MIHGVRRGDWARGGRPAVEAVAGREGSREGSSDGGRDDSCEVGASESDAEHGLLDGRA